MKLIEARRPQREVERRIRFVEDGFQGAASKAGQEEVSRFKFQGCRIAPPIVLDKSVLET